MFGQIQWRSARVVRVVFIVARVSALSAGMYGAGYFSGVTVITGSHALKHVKAD